MSEIRRIVPFQPEIARFPKEQKLEGVPHRTTESILLQPGVAYALDIMEDARKGSSRERREFFDALTSRLAKKNPQKASLSKGLETIITNAHPKKGEQTTNRAIFVKSKLDLQEQEKALFTDEGFNALHDTDAFRTHLEAFATYRSVGRKKKKTIIETQARSFFQHPDQFLRYALIQDVLLQPHSELLSDEVINYREFHKNLQNQFTNLAEDPASAALDQEALVSWMKIFVGDSHYGPFAEKLLQKWIADDDPEKVIDHVHQLATAMFTQENPKLIQVMLDVIGLQTPLLPFDSNAAIDYTIAAPYASREARQKKQDVDDAEKIITTSYGEFFKKTVTQNTLARFRQTHSAKARKRIPQHIKKSSKENLQEIIDNKSIVKDLAGKINRPFPTKKTDAELETIATPLRRWINETIAEQHKVTKLSRKRQMTGEIQLPGFSRTIKAPLPEVVNVVNRTIGELEPQTLDQPEHWRTLALLVPHELDQRKIDQLQTINRQLRQEIIDDRLRGISQRGDKLLITNSQVKRLGFTSIELHHQKNGYSLIVDVQGKNLVDSLIKLGKSLIRDMMQSRGSPLRAYS